MNNENFTQFIKKHATQRRIANIFAEMRDQQQQRKKELGIQGHFSENSVAAALLKRKTILFGQKKEFSSVGANLLKARPGAAIRPQEMQRNFL